MNNYLALLSKKKFDEAEELRKSKVPTRLIKFISLNEIDAENEKKLQTLRNRKIWFSAISELNDPYELQGMFIDRQTLHKRGFPDEVIHKFEKLLHTLCTKWALVSLSANKTDYLPMWAYYSNNSRGFCIEYEVVKPDVISQVWYEEKRIPIASIITSVYAEYHKLVETSQENNPELDFYLTVLKQQFFLKHLSWVSENEYRIIYPISTGKGILVKEADVGLRVTRIIAGINCSKAHRVQLNEISNAIGCGNISTLHISETDYTLIEDE